MKMTGKEQKVRVIDEKTPLQVSLPERQRMNVSEG